MEHELEGSPLYAGKNRIVGHIIHADFGNDEIKEGTLYPKESHPVKCIGVLYGRIGDAQAIIEDVNNGYEWRVSMEVDRKEEQDVFVAGENIIRQDDEKWDEVLGKWSQAKTYNGSAIGLALGGTGLDENDYANLFGAGMVMNPADKDAKVHKWMMAPAAMKGENPYDFVGIAVDVKKVIGEENMSKKIVFESNTDMSSASLSIDGEDQGKLASVSIYGNEEYGDGEMEANWTKEVRDGDVVQYERFHYDPETATVKKGESNMGINLAEHRKEIDEVKKSFANHKTPDEVTAAVADEKEKFKGFVSPDDAKTATDEAVKDALKERNAQDTAYANREKAITDAKLELNDGRKETLREFEVASDGDKKFNDWLKDLTDGQVAMADNLKKEKKVEDITDAINKNLASYDGVNDQRFVAFASAIGHNNGVETEAPSEGGGDNSKVDLEAV